MRLFRPILLLMMLSACALCGAETTGLPNEVLREVVAPQLLPAGRYIAARRWDAVSGSGHQTGRAVDDPQATSGRAWEAHAGRDRQSGAMLYGPYVDMEPGDYVAFFRVRPLEENGEETVASIDACVDYGQNVLAARDLMGGDLAEGRYTQAPLAFRYPGGKLEMRVAWKGDTSLRVDQVALYRLEGANLAEAPGKAHEAVLSGKPNNLAEKREPRPFPEIFPRSAPPAKRLLVVDLRRERPDRQLMLLCLQGLVNRTKPEVYAIYQDTDTLWLDHMRKRGWITGSQEMSGDDLLARYRSRIKGIVITDPRLPASKNVATMLAGVRNGLAVSPRLATGMNLPVLADLRGRWTTSVDAYRWAFDNLWPKLNHHVIAVSYPDHLGLRDYLVQNRVFIFWISGPIDGARPYANPTNEARLMEQLLAKMPVNIPAMSYPWAAKDVGIGEGPGVTLLAEFGKYLVGSIDAANLSVHSGIRIPKLTQRKAPPAPKLDTSKVYVTWLMSDGDNLPVLTNGNFPQLWQDRARGEVPMAWTVSPSAYMLIPDVVDYYYSTEKPGDNFVAAVSGIGYTYPDSYADRFRQPDRQRIFDGFLGQTGDYMKRMDLQSAWIMNATRPAVIRRYAEKLPWLDAIFPDYGRRVSGYDQATYPSANGVPVFHALTTWKENATRDQKIADLVSEIRRLTPLELPAFMHLFIWNWGADMTVFPEVMRRLGSGYVAVRPDHLAALCRQDLAKRQALVRAPSLISAIEGQPIAFTLTVQNVSSKPFRADAAVTGGLSGASIKPARVALKPTQSASLAVSGVPSGRTVSLEARGPFGARQVKSAVSVIPASEIDGSLPAGARLRFVQRFDATQLSHIIGRPIADPADPAHTIFVAERGQDKPAMHMLFGPYADLKPGRYVALFRLKRTGEGDGPLVTVDAGPAGGKTPMTTRDLTASQLPVGQWRRIALVFQHPGGPYETRLFWKGAASLAADSIELFAIEP